jgi:hypothetical protein
LSRRGGKKEEEELRRVLPHIAAKLNIPLDQLKQQILSGSAAIVERRPDTVGHHLAFGGEDALRSIAKSCFVLLATKVGSDALKGAAFEDARNFVLNGSDAFYRSPIAAVRERANVPRALLATEHRPINSCIAFIASLN